MALSEKAELARALDAVLMKPTYLMRQAWGRLHSDSLSPAHRKSLEARIEKSAVEIQRHVQNYLSLVAEANMREKKS